MITAIAIWLAMGIGMAYKEVSERKQRPAVKEQKLEEKEILIQPEFLKPPSLPEKKKLPGRVRPKSLKGLQKKGGR